MLCRTSGNIDNTINQDVIIPYVLKPLRRRIGATHSKRYFALLIIAITWLFPAHRVFADREATLVYFDIPAGQLAESLHLFSNQSGLQILYESEITTDLLTQPLEGRLPIKSALDRLLEGTDLAWLFATEKTIAITRSTRSNSVENSRDRRHYPANDLAVLRDILVNSDPRRVLPLASSQLPFGLEKSVLDTPRSVSFISEELIDLFGLSAVEDLVRVVPGAYTTTRFGIQGSIDIRNISADSYVQGMKRLNLQGHGRSLLGANDAIEIVRGPPSPLYGMGKMGGYTNVVPKSGRAREGNYLLEPQGFYQGVLGSYDHSAISFGGGGPLGSLRENPGGYYVYGLLESSNTYTTPVEIGQRMLQGALSFDNFLGPLRAEMGVNYQRSTTSGALLNRVNQTMIDKGIYLSGQPLVNLDANGNGKIGFLEMHSGSPVQGDLSNLNQPLIQYWDWPRDAQGNFIPLEEFAKVKGIPQTFYDYLMAYPEADPTGALRAQGPGGPVPISGQVPVGFALDPRSVETTRVDLRRAGAFEREVEADFTWAFFDLIYDQDSRWTIKNQLFFDSMDQYKLSEQPGGGKQDVWVWEDKLTMARHLPDATSWLALNLLGSVNWRGTKATGYRYVGDQGSHRTDMMARQGQMTPNTTFVHPFENSDVERDGAPWFSRYRSTYWELGGALMVDAVIHDDTHLLFGFRYDLSRAGTLDYGDTLDPFAGNSADPGALRTARRVSGRDDGFSWSASVTRQLPWGWRLYSTLAESSLTLESNNNRMPAAVIENGHIGSARLTELGIKGTHLDHSLFFSASWFEQSRTDVTDETDTALLAADVSSTTTTGFEAEFKWVPLPRMFLSLYGLHQTTDFSPNYAANILVDARTLGFQDVYDNDGNLIFPAEAFLYGGRSFLRLPEGMEPYQKKQGNPEVQAGLAAHYQFKDGWGLTFSGNYFSDVYSGRLKQVRLPSARVYNAGVFLDRGPWHFQIDCYNLFGEVYFRPRTGDNLGETLVSAMPDRHWKATFRIRF